MPSSSSSSWAKFGVMITTTILAVVILGVDAKPKCSGGKVKQAYIDDVNALVQKLQQEAPYNPPYMSATDTVGSVRGTAKCDYQNLNDCLSCLAVALVELAVDCKGKAVGKSNGTDQCKMTFRPA